MSDQDIFTPGEWQRIADRITVRPKTNYNSSIPLYVRNRVELRDDGLCIYCKEAPGTECDHVIPASHGGPTIPENIVLSCKSCNIRKRATFSIHYLTIAFNHLLYKEENIDWIENIFLPELEEEEKEDKKELPVEEDHRRRRLICLNCHKQFDYYGDPEEIKYCFDCEV